MITGIIMGGLVAIIILLLSFDIALVISRKNYRQDFENSQDNLATATAEYMELEQVYKGLFCITFECGNLKYHTFNLCSVCVSKFGDGGGGRIEDNLETPQNKYVTTGKTEADDNAQI